MNKLNSEGKLIKPNLLLNESEDSSFRFTGDKKLDTWNRLTDDEKRKFNGFEGFKKGEFLDSNNQFSKTIDKQRQKKREEQANLTEEERIKRRIKAKKYYKRRKNE